MKFKNIAVPDEHKDLYAKVKWHLWHGKTDTALISRWRETNSRYF